MNFKNMTVLAEEFKQRAFDGKWQRWVKYLDVNNAYTFTNEIGSRVTLIPEAWVVTDVYDYLLTVEEWK
jgi:hypothetical protein